jgi:hypothetical protein
MISRLTQRTDRESQTAPGRLGPSSLTKGGRIDLNLSKDRLAIGRVDLNLL